MSPKTAMIVVGLMALSMTAFAQADPPSLRFQEQRIGSIPSGMKKVVYSADGCHIAIVVERQDKWHLELDGRPGPEYYGIDGLVFSPDGKRVGYGARVSEKWAVVVDGQPGPEYDAIGTPVFSPDGKRLAYYGVKGDKHMVVVDG